MSRPPLAWIAGGALALALLSVGLNLYLLDQLRRPERWLAPAAERLARRVAAGDATLRYTVRIPPGTPLRLDVPVDERFAIRVDTVIPIDTRVRVPFRTPFGNQSVTVPFRADIPLRTRLPLHVRHTFRLRTRTTAPIEIPLEIRLGELPLEQILR